MSAFESSQIHAKVQQALFRRMLAVNRLVPNGVESPGVGSAQNLKDSLATGQAFLPQDIIIGDKNPYEQQILRSAFCKVSADVVDTNTGDIMNFSSYITGGPGGKGEATQANRPISFKDKINPDSNSYRGDTGVQSVSIAQKSYFMNEITINWICPDPMDFEKRIQPIFLKHGRMIFVEFGFGINSSKEFEQLSQIGTKSVAGENNPLDREILLLNSAHPDRYQVFRGLVTKYDFKITDYGGYSGTITLASKGKNILETPIQKATQQTSSSTSAELGVNDYKKKLKEKIEKESKTTEEQGEDFIGPQKSTEKELKEKFSDTEVHFKAVIEALPEVVDRYVKQAEPKGVTITENNQGKKDAVIPPVRKLNYYYKNGAMNYFFGAGVDINPDDDPWFGPVVTKLYEEVKQAGGELVDSKETFWKRAWGGVKLLGAAGLAVAGAVGSGVVAAGVAVVATGAAVVTAGRALVKVGKMATEELFESEINDKQEKSTHLVTWGWFEDHILNSFFQVQASTSNGTQTLQQIRSVHLPYKYEVEQYINTEEGKRKSQINRQDKSYNVALLREIESQEEGGEASTEEEFQNVQRLIEANDKMSVVSDSKYFVSNRCANSPSLQSIGLDSVVIPGQTNKFWEEEVVSGSQFEPTPNQQLDVGQAGVAIGTTVATAAGFANPVSLVAAGTYLFKKRNQNIDQQVVRKLYGVINEEFPSFKVDDSMESGYIRNLVFDVKYLQDSFKDITNLKQGLRDFWAKVKADMFDYNGFQITQDLSDDGRVGITDTKYQNPIENAKDLLSSKKQSQAEEFADEKALSNKMFFLPVYTKNSIVRSFSVGLKLTDKAASMAALGSNIGTDGKSSTYHYDIGIESFAQATALQSGPDKSVNKEIADTYNLTKEQVEREQKLKNLVVNDLHTFVGGTDKIGSGANVQHGNKTGQTDLKVTDNSGVDFSGVSEVLKNIDDINNELENLDDTKDKDGGKDSKEKLGSIYDNKGRMKKRPKELISSTINKSLGPNPNQEGHYNLNKTIIPIELSLTLDGIGGLRVGNMFKTDYLPELYRKYSYFTITEVSHAVGMSGWTTDITAMMKLDRVKMIEDGLITKRGGNVSTKASNEELLQNAQDAGRDYYFDNEGKYTVIEKPTDEPDKTAEEKELIQPVEETITTTEPTTKRTDGVRLKSGKVLYPRDEGYEEANIVKKRELDKKRKDEIPSIVPDPTQPSSYNTR